MILEALEPSQRSPKPRRAKSVERISQMKPHLLEKTIFHISSAQVSATLPLSDHLRVCLSATVNRAAQGNALGFPQMVADSDRRAMDIAEQIRILENITTDEQDDFEAETETQFLTIIEGAQS
jgi:hypothetical protein